MKKKLKVRILTIALLATLLLGGLSAAAYSYNTFYGGVTGIPGYGKTWGEYTPRGKRVYVTAKGRTTKTSYASSMQRCYSSVGRAFSGNRSWWGNR